MKQSNEKFPEGPSEIGPGLEDLIRRGAREAIRQAIDAELAKTIHYEAYQFLGPLFARCDYKENNEFVARSRR